MIDITKVLPFIDVKKAKSELVQLNPLVLAFVGDSVQQLAVRTSLAFTSTAKAGELHKAATQEIKATTQAIKMDKIYANLTQEEMEIYKRTRNTKMNTVAKNATLADYRKASGLEALIGYLYLSGERERLLELINIMQEEVYES